MTNVNKSFDSGDDVFCFKKRSFQVQNNYEDSDSEDDDDFLPSRKRLKTTKSLLERLDDDIDDEESVAETKNSTTGSNCAVKRAIDILTDDDDDSSPCDDTFKHQDSLQVLRQAQQAREGLERAQKYHAEEVVDNNDENQTTCALSIDLPSQARLGAKWTTQIQVIEEIEGMNEFTINPLDNVMNYIRKLEPFQKMIDRLKKRGQTSLSVSSSFISKIQLERKNDGTILDLTKTPASYNQKEEDLTYLVLRIIRKGNNFVRRGFGFVMEFVLRSQKKGTLISEDNFRLRSKEPFSNLLESYKKVKCIRNRHTKVVLEFDGEALGMKDTPETHDMESGDIIEVKLK
eukprot:CAMPEP_0194148368 /NCGR_PEP_ID=MMETSP0152-20130528/31906_1 /TAXON_ID=1049557 /ORGANISM="Thalassiothrix antarctica, Strain L6-D1" /LENGTH=344 /DNA_ID=CAMNT_0038849865 /DNA_START=182 /DNA_END=1216 /DNA_ORIENTATION=+